MKNDNLKEQYRINERIRVREVRLVGDNVEQGVFLHHRHCELLKTWDLILLKFRQMLPPVCKVTDYQKFLYQQKSVRKSRKLNLLKWW